MVCHFNKSKVEILSIPFFVGVILDLHLSCINFRNILCKHKLRASELDKRHKVLLVECQTIWINTFILFVVFSSHSSYKYRTAKKVERVEPAVKVMLDLTYLISFK